MNIDLGNQVIISTTSLATNAKLARLHLQVATTVRSLGSTKMSVVKSNPTLSEVSHPMM